MAIRLTDVAQHAGVSPRTVSNVVNGYEHVSPGMRARVQSAIDELGYSPNLTARRLVRGRTGTIEFVVPWISSSYFAQLAAAVIDAAAARGYVVLVGQTNADPARELAAVANRGYGAIDGTVFAPSALSSTQIARARTNTPLVLLGEAAMPMGTAHVQIDNVEASRAATAHLLEIGRKRIAYIGASEGRQHVLNAIAGDRVLGWQLAIEEAGLSIDPELVIATDDWTARGGFAAAGRLLDLAKPVDAVLCTEDNLAIGTLRRLASRGVAVPDDIAVVGQGDIAVAEFLHPPLTTIAPDRHAIADLALDLLTRQIEGDTTANAHLLAPFSLAIRESTIGTA